MPVPPTPPCELRPEGGIRSGITYTTVRHINKGQMANAYEARDSSGVRVFLKAYISPTPAVDWYRDYIAYIKAINHRIATSTASVYCEKAVDTFEAKVGRSAHPTFFQVHDFVDGGHDLESILKRASSVPGSLTWNQRISMAKVTVSCLRQLHEARIVHCDLKPANIIMESVDAAIGYRPKLIDLDSSILADREAPWHGKGQGYVGSPNYYSPEHLMGGASKPVQASDVFTVALILYEILGQGNPYKSDDPIKYNQKAMGGNPAPISLLGPLSVGTVASDFGGLLKRALSPVPSERPTMADLHTCLLRMNPAAPGVPPPHRPAPPPSPISPPVTTTPPVPPVAGPGSASPATSAPAKKPESESPSVTAVPRPAPPRKPEPTVPLAVAARIHLRGDKGELDFGVTARLGKALLNSISSESIFASEPQFELVSLGSGWILRPSPTAKNATGVNDKIVLEDRKLTDGDIICLLGQSGRRAMRITVSIK